MAGSESKQVNQALEEMMADLGNHRMEELAVDEPSAYASYGRLKPLGNAMSANVLMKPAAIRENCFNDDDAAGVKGLDTLDGGNAHRLKRLMGTGLYAPTPPPPRTHKSRYNPSQPTYGRSSRQKADRPYLDTENLQVSRLGGVIPDGGDVKRWDSGKYTTQVESGDLPMSLSHTPTQGISSGQIAHIACVRPKHGMLPPCSKTSAGQQARNVNPAAPGILIDSQRPSTRSTDTAADIRAVFTSRGCQKMFFSDDILVLEDVNGVGKRLPGQVAIYRTGSPSVCVCEVTIHDVKVITVDVRALIRLFVDGSRVILRRNGPNGEGIRVNTLYFENIPKAKGFQEEADRLKGQFEHSSTKIASETSVKLPLVRDDTAQIEIGKPADTVEQQHDASAIKQSQVAQSIGEQPELAKPVTEMIQPNDPPLTSINVLATEQGQSAQTEVAKLIPESDDNLVEAAAENVVKEAVDGFLGDLIDFSVSPSRKPSELLGKEGMARLDNQFLSTFYGTVSEAEMKEPNDALEDFEMIHDSCAGKSLSKESRRLLYGIISTDYDDMIKTSDTLANALKDSSFSSPAFIASILHLLQRGEFLDLCWSEKKKAIAVVYNNVGHAHSRNTRLPEEILALRSVEGGTSRGPMLYRPSGNDLQSKGSPPSANDAPFQMPAQTLKPSAKPSEGLLDSTCDFDWSGEH
ncbi:hypothetical protein GGS21DRAFT_492160 [Xylaria nigripes]|nr:hypothetical protein GGS21DRAFT_492160 [Xylaria nigripes]